METRRFSTEWRYFKRVISVGGDLEIRYVATNSCASILMRRESQDLLPNLHTAKGHDFVPQYPLAPSLKLPSLDDFQFGNYSLDGLSVPETIDTASSSDHGQVGEDEGNDREDIWAQPATFEDGPKTQTPRSWEGFYDRTHKEKLSYLSDAGPGVWEAFLRSSAITAEGTDGHKNHEEPVVVKQDAGLRSLFLLGMGLESVLFECPVQRPFRPRTKNWRLFGLSQEVMDSVGEEFGVVGANFLKMESFARQVCNDPAVSPTRVALAETMRTLVRRLEQHLIQSLPSRRSFLHLQSLFRRPGSILERLYALLQKTKSRTRDEDILDAVYDFALENEYSDPWFTHLAQEILTRVSTPWLDGVSALVGLRHKVLVKRGAIRSIEAAADAYAAGDLDCPDIVKSMPKFVSEEDREVTLQACHTLSLLEVHEENFLNSSTNLQPPVLEWGFSYPDIERIEAKVHQYERHINATLQGLNEARKVSNCVEANLVDTTTVNPFGTSKEQVEEDMFRSCDILDHDLQDECETDGQDSFHSAISNALLQQDTRGDLLDIPPPLSITSSLSFHPVLSCHSRYLSLCLLRTLFTQHKLPNHFTTLHLFHLFGSGTFTIRLTQALFSPNLLSTERNSGNRRPVAASAGAPGDIGLRLGSRTTWPPASSELRLALAGILTDSYRASSLSAPESLPDSEPPGSLSFAICPLSQPEIEACLDPHSLSALDFLHLSYTPPPALEPIVTAPSLDAYDQIFRLLLRTTRVLFASTSLQEATRSSRGERNSIPVALRRLRFESHVFVSASAAHFYAEVASLWTPFECAVRELASKLERPDALQVLGEWDSLHGLRSRHEGMLEQMRGALLLRHRQAKVMHALEEVWSLILADGSRTQGASGNQGDTKRYSNDASSKTDPSTAASRQLHNFRTKRKAFLDLYRSSRDKDAASDGHGMDGLLLRLQMSSWEPS